MTIQHALSRNWLILTFGTVAVCMATFIPLLFEGIMIKIVAGIMNCFAYAFVSVAGYNRISAVPSQSSLIKKTISFAGVIVASRFFFLLLSLSSILFQRFGVPYLYEVLLSPMYAFLSVIAAGMATHTVFDSLVMAGGLVKEHSKLYAMFSLLMALSLTSVYFVSPTLFSPLILGVLGFVSTLVYCLLCMLAITVFQVKILSDSSDVERSNPQTEEQPA